MMSFSDGFGEVMYNGDISVFVNKSWTMRFWKKACIFAFMILICISQTYLNEIGNVNVLIKKYEISLGIYEALAIIIFALFILSTALSVAACVTSIFKRDSVSAEEKMVNSIANLVVMDDCEFSNSIKKLCAPKKFKPITNAMLAKRGIAINIDKIGIPQVDILIIKLKLKDRLAKGDSIAAINLAKEAISKYHWLVSAIQDEIIEVAKLAKMSHLPFCFDPRKFKYCLATSFADIYFASLAIAEIDEETDIEKRLKYLEKAFKNYPDNQEITSRLLALYAGDESNLKKAIKIIEIAFQARPDRALAYPIIQLCRNDALEVAEKISDSTSDINLEKQWFLFIIATRLNIIGRAKEILKQLVNLDKSIEIAKFYIQNHSKLSFDPEITEIVMRTCDEH
jgi:tetratricopeptide (TPR) repeat protein